MTVFDEIRSYAERCRRANIEPDPYPMNATKMAELMDDPRTHGLLMRTSDGPLRDVRLFGVPLGNIPGL